MLKKPTLILATTLATSLVAADVSAQSPVQVSIGRGTNVGSFVTFGPTVTCPDGTEGTAFGQGFVFASDSLTVNTGSRPTRTNGVSIEIFGYSDSCGTNIGFGSGGFANGYTPPRLNLKSAAIAGTTTVQDFDSGAVYPVSVNLVFTGDGPLSITKAGDVTHDAGTCTVTIQRDASTSRDATVMGTLTINGAEPDAVYSSTTLNGNSDTTIQIQKKN